MVGVEIDMVVSESLKALELYEKIFEIERVEVTNLPKGENEVIFNLFGVRFHMLDETEAYGLKAPDPDHPNTIWFNILVPDINETFKKAMDAGCTVMQPVTELPDYGVSNAIFTDKFGYMWMLHQMHKEVSLEERLNLWETEKGKNKEQKE
ncbi:MAG: VOC family protein [Clostridiaceae bacterium]